MYTHTRTHLLVVLNKGDLSPRSLKAGAGILVPVDVINAIGLVVVPAGS